jgi:maltose alpha-D-glucosyltransferase/alpha-amylase
VDSRLLDPVRPTCSAPEEDSRDSAKASDTRPASSVVAVESEPDTLPPAADAAVRASVRREARASTDSERSVSPMPAGPKSETMIVYGERVLLKLYRKVEPGSHPEAEILAALGRRPVAAPVPPLLACLRLQNAKGETYDAGVLRRFVPEATNGWLLARRALDEFLAVPNAPRHANTFAETARRLGGVTRQLHEALAGRFADTPHAARAATRDDLEQWGRRIRRLVTHTLHQLNSSCDDGALPAQLYRDARAVVNRSTKVTDRVDHLMSSFGSQLGVVMRTHGHSRLQDILSPRNGALLVGDFAGDPEHVFAERRALESPLRDVASMLRSFASVTAVAVDAHIDLASRARVQEQTAHWERSARTAFLRGYMGPQRGSPSAVLPPRRDAVSKLVTLFEIEALFGELHSRILHEPTRVGMPLRRIRALLDL